MFENIKGVLFDFDETLQHGTYDELFQRTKAIINHLNCSIEDDTLKKYCSLSDWKDIKQSICNNIFISENLFNYINNKFSGNFDHLFYLNENTLNLLNELKKKNIKIGLVTTRGSFSLYRLLNKYNISYFFDAIIDRECCEERKPHPKPISLCLDKMNLLPKDCVFVGDRQVDDIIAGNALKMKTILVSANDRDLHGAIPDLHCRHLGDVLAAFRDDTASPAPNTGEAL